MFLYKSYFNGFKSKICKSDSMNIFDVSFCKTTRHNIKDISGPSSRAMQMRARPFGNAHRMQLQISPGYTGLFVPQKPRLFHGDVSFILLPGNKSFTRIWQLFNLAQKRNKGGKTPQENTEILNFTSICEVFNLSNRFSCWQHSGERFITSKQPLPGY